MSGSGLNGGDLPGQSFFLLVAVFELHTSNSGDVSEIQLKGTGQNWMIYLGPEYPGGHSSDSGVQWACTGECFLRSMYPIEVAFTAVFHISEKTELGGADRADRNKLANSAGERQ